MENRKNHRQPKRNSGCLGVDEGIEPPHIYCVKGNAEAKFRIHLPSPSRFPFSFPEPVEGSGAEGNSTPERHLNGVSQVMGETFTLVVQQEARIALDLQKRRVFGDLYLIPLRLEKCDFPQPEMNDLTWIDLEQDWEEGIEKIRTLVMEKKQLLLEPISSA